MPAAVKDLYVEAGATFRLPTITWCHQGDVAGTPGDPVDLTGATARMQIRADLAAGPIVTATTENGKIVLGGAAGTIHLTLSDADTDSLGITKGVYDLEVVIPDGSSEAPGVYRLLQGKVKVSPNVTRED